MGNKIPPMVQLSSASQNILENPPLQGFMVSSSSLQIYEMLHSGWLAQIQMLQHTQCFYYVERVHAGSPLDGHSFVLAGGQW